MNLNYKVEGDTVHIDGSVEVEVSATAPPRILVVGQRVNTGMTSLDTQLQHMLDEAAGRGVVLAEDVRVEPWPLDVPEDRLLTACTDMVKPRFSTMRDLPKLAIDATSYPPNRKQRRAQAARARRGEP